MKKRLLSMLLVLLLLLSAMTFAACGDKQTEEQGKTEEPVVDPTPDEPEESDEPDEPETPTEPEGEPAVPTDINMDSEFPVKRIDFYTTELSRFVIVIAQGADDHIVHAANELSSYLYKAAGYEIPVDIDTCSAAMYEICVGPTNRDTTNVKLRRETLENDGVMYYAEGNRLYLGSESSLGTEYAVYRFLYDYIGWRCLSNRSEVIHEATYIRIPKDLDYTYSSPLTYRKTDWGLNATTNLKYSLNAETDTAHSIIGFCHTMGALSETGDGGTGSGQPCLCSEEVYQTVLRNVKKWIEANPGCKWVSVTQNDNQNYCTCEQCTALAEKENQSGVLLTFINRLADEIKVDYPDVSIVTFAYCYTRKPPVTVVPADNVIIWMCDIECCFSHALDDPTCEENAAFCEDLKGWMAITDRIMFWDYTTDYHMYLAPFPDLLVLQKNAALLSANAVGIYEEGNYQMESAGEFSELRSYMIAQLLWNPSMSEEEYLNILAEYCDDYYGPGGKYVYQYILQTSEKVQNIHLGIYQCLNEDGGCLYYKEDGSVDHNFIAKMTKLWDKAYAAAETDEQRTHIAYNRLHHDLIQLQSTAMTKGVDVEATTAYLQKLQELKDYGLYWFSEDPYLQTLNHSIDWLLETQTAATPRKWIH